VRDIAWHPKHPELCFAANDDQLRFSDIGTDVERRATSSDKVNTGPFISVSWSPGGRSVAAGTITGQVCIVDSTNARETRQFRELHSPVVSVSWSPDGRLIAGGSSDGQITIWDVETSKLLRSLHHDRQRLLSLVWSQDGVQIAAGYENQVVRIWGVESRQIEHEIGAKTANTGSLAWCPDRTLIAGGLEGRGIHLWKSDVSEFIPISEQPPSGKSSVSLSADSQIIGSMSEDGTAVLVAFEGLQEIGQFREPASGLVPAKLIFHPSLRLLATCGEEDGTIRVYEYGPISHKVESSHRMSLAFEGQPATKAEEGERKPETAALSDISMHFHGASDQSTADDSLGFAPYVDAIAHFLSEDKTQAPLTMSIEGDWGSGKSSFMKQLREKLRNDGAVTVWFNAWRHDKEESLWAAFATEFLKQVSARVDSWKRLKASFYLLVLRLSWKTGLSRLFPWVVGVSLIALPIILIAILLYFALGELVPWFIFLLTFYGVISQEVGSLLQVTGWLGAFSVLVWGVIRILKSVANPLVTHLRGYFDAPDYAARVAFVERFHEDFDRIVAAYAGNQKVYVFIDDLDRCEIPKAAELMQAINMMISDESRLIYLMGMDREKVAAGLAVKFEKLIPLMCPQRETSDAASKESTSVEAAMNFGSEFIEKFVQLSFGVPKPEVRDIRRLLRKMAEREEEGATPTKRKSTSPDSVRSDPGAVTSAVPAASTSQGSVQGPRESPPSPSQLRELRLRTAPESDEIHDLVVLFADCLGRNPRRIKQFVNLLRLRTYIAYHTGLFLPRSGKDLEVQLTFHKLAKICAMQVRWPGLVRALEQSFIGMALLESWALHDDVNVAAHSAELSRWTKVPGLQEFFKIGLLDVNGKRLTKNYPIWSLAKLPFDIIRRVSPPPLRVTPPPATLRTSAVDPTVINSDTNRDKSDSGEKASS
jgi:hypothetical protein